MKEIRYATHSDLEVGEARIELSIVDWVAGDSPSEIVIRRMFVTPDLQFLKAEVLPVYAVGERVILCLRQSQSGYGTTGLYNGKFVIEQGNVRGTSISAEMFKQQIRELRRGDREQLPPDLPRMTGSEVRHPLGEAGKAAEIMSDGSHLGGEFITWDFTWNPSYLPVAVSYNTGGAPSNAPIATTIASLAETAYDLWSDSYSFLTIENNSPFTTSQGHVNNTTNVILWGNLGDPDFLAVARPHPNDPATGTFFGAGSNTGLDIIFNNDIDLCTWYFSQTAPGFRSCSQIDFIEVLAHELGHGLGLQHVTKNESSIMYRAYDKNAPVRSQSDGDLAGVSHQHTVTTLPGGTLPHSLVLSASGSTFDVSGTITVPSGKIFEAESGITLPPM